MTKSRMAIVKERHDVTYYFEIWGYKDHPYVIDTNTEFFRLYKGAFQVQYSGGLLDWLYDTHK